MESLLALAFAFADFEPRSPGARAQRPAVAVVRVVKPGRATSSDWRSAAPLTKREIVVEEADGRKTVVRVIEHE